MENQKELLIQILFDKYSTITEKDDAAIDLRGYPEKEVIDALLSKGADINEDQIVLNSCGESLGSIWSELDIFDKKAFSNLAKPARFGLKYAVESRKPDWVNKYNL